MDYLIYSVKNDIEGSIANARIAKYLSDIRRFILDDINKDGNISIPTIDSLGLEEGFCPSLGKELLEEYNKIYDGYSHGVSRTIDANLRIEQVAMFESMLFGLNIHTGAIDLYTANYDIVGRFGNSYKRNQTHVEMLEKAYEQNTWGCVYACRLDLEYITKEKVDLKAVSLSKNRWLKADDYLFFPYEYVRESMNVLTGLLEKGRVVKVLEDYVEYQKTRYVTCNPKILRRYCSDFDDALLPEIRTEVFPMKGYMYAPVIGAPATTSLLTKVNLFLLGKVEVLKNYNEIKVEKIDNSVISSIKENCILRSLNELEVKDIFRYEELVRDFQGEGFENYFEDGQGGGYVLSRYLHTLGKDEIDGIMGTIPNCIDFYNSYSKLFNNFAVEKFDSPERLKELLKDFACVVVWKNKNCELSSAIVTNNKDLLRKIYGNDYFGRYEALNVRTASLLYRIRNGNPVYPAAKYCGFNTKDPAVRSIIDEYVNDVRNGEYSRVKDDKVLEEMRKAVGYGMMTVSSTTSILSRVIFAPIIEGELYNYYRYLPVERIVRIERLFHS